MTNGEYNDAPEITDKDVGDTARGLVQECDGNTKEDVLAYADEKIAELQAEDPEDPEIEILGQARSLLAERLPDELSNFDTHTLDQ